MRWLSDDNLMTIWWLSHDYPMTIPWLSHDYPMTIRWLSHDYPMTIPWLSDDYPITIRFNEICEQGLLSFCGARRRIIRFKFFPDWSVSIPFWFLERCSVILWSPRQIQWFWGFTTLQRLSPDRKEILLIPLFKQSLFWFCSSQNHLFLSHCSNTLLF